MNQKKTKFVAIRLTEEMKNSLAYYAEKNGRNQNMQILYYIKKGLESES
jgi:predicted DNA-binding protein